MSHKEQIHVVETYAYLRKKLSVCRKRYTEIQNLIILIDWFEAGFNAKRIFFCKNRLMWKVILVAALASLCPYVNSKLYQHVYRYDAGNCDDIDNNVPASVMSEIISSCQNITCYSATNQFSYTAKCTDTQTPPLVPFAEFIQLVEFDRTTRVRTGVCIKSEDGNKTSSFKFTCGPVSRQSCNADCSACQDYPLPIKTTCVNLGTVKTKANTTEAKPKKNMASNQMNVPVFLITTAATF